MPVAHAAGIFILEPWTVMATSGIDPLNFEISTSTESDGRAPRARRKHTRVENASGLDAHSLARLTRMLDAFEFRVESVHRSVKQAHDELGRIRCDLEAMVRAAPATSRPGRNAVATLTRQERRIALLAASGLSNSEVAAVINIKTETVRGHMKGVSRKLAIHSRWELAYLLGPDGRSYANQPARLDRAEP
jgi:DNA-binding CsgD family transcriptional regulator